MIKITAGTACGEVELHVVNLRVARSVSQPPEPSPARAAQYAVTHTLSIAPAIRLPSLFAREMIASDLPIEEKARACTCSSR